MGRVFQGMSVMAGLVAYAASFYLPSAGQYLSLGGGILVGFGITGLVGLHHTRVATHAVHARPDRVDTALREATSRVLSGAGSEKPWAVVERVGFSNL